MNYNLPFQPELKNEIQQLVETELFSHFKKLIVKFQEEGFSVLVGMAPLELIFLS
jgi:hypothetical protein